MAAAPHARPARPHPNPSQCAVVLTELLREHEPTIVALQESAPAILAQADLAAYEPYRGPGGLTTLALRRAYRPVSNQDIRQRVQVVALDSATHGEAGLLLFNVHLPVLYKSEYERQEYIRRLMPDINRLRVQNQTRLEIMVGDFNLPPYDVGIVGESGLFANRDAAHVARKRSTVGRPICNVSWSIFGGTCGALGTYHGASAAHGPWQVPDQLLLDPRLLQGSCVRVQVLTATAGVQLHTALPLAYPNKAIASDHFPVLTTLSPSPAAS